MTELTPSEWKTFLADYPDAHLLQTAAWGELKSAFGWKACRVGDGNNGALVLIKRLGPGIRMAYIPRGPVGGFSKPLLVEIDRLCRREAVFALKVEPDCWLETNQPEGPGAGLEGMVGFVPSPQNIQPPRTLLVSLAGSENDILMRMKQKTRYNIHLAEKKGITLSPSTDIPAYHKLAVETGARDRFQVHSQAYYQKAFDLFHPGGNCELLLAESEGELLAGLMVFRSGLHAYYLYGASSDKGRNLMSTYLLQWEAMRWAKLAGCVDYDLWGVPDAPLEVLERDFTSRADGLWGVYRFKRGFGGVLKRTPGTFDRVYKPAVYLLYKFWLGVWGQRG